jgi:hypothetical protein
MNWDAGILVCENTAYTNNIRPTQIIIPQCLMSPVSAKQCYDLPIVAKLTIKKKRRSKKFVILVYQKNQMNLTAQLPGEKIKLFADQNL